MNSKGRGCRSSERRWGRGGEERQPAVEARRCLGACLYAYMVYGLNILFFVILVVCVDLKKSEECEGRRLIGIS